MARRSDKDKAGLPDDASSSKASSIEASPGDTMSGEYSPGNMPVVSPGDQSPPADVEAAYSEEKFWSKLRRYAVSAGKDVVEAALKLFYAMQDPDTPASAKAIIVGALAYFIIPIDAVADFLPGGYVDDWGALMGAFWAVAKHVKQEHTERAKAKLREWFPEGE